MRRFLSCLVITIILLFCLSGGCRAAQEPTAMTRAQAAELIYHMCGDPLAVYDARFVDVDAAHAQCAAIYWLAEVGISFGTGDSCYAPDRDITLCEYETMLARLCTMLGWQAKEPTESTELISEAGGQKLLERLFNEY